MVRSNEEDEETGEVFLFGGFGAALGGGDSGGASSPNHTRMPPARVRVVFGGCLCLVRWIWLKIAGVPSNRWRCAFCRRCLEVE